MTKETTGIGARYLDTIRAVSPVRVNTTISFAPTLVPARTAEDVLFSEELHCIEISDPAFVLALEVGDERVQVRNLLLHSRELGVRLVELRVRLRELLALRLDHRDDVKVLDDVDGELAQAGGGGAPAA